MTEEKIHKNRTGSWWALSPLLVFLCLYLVTSILVNDFYKVPITVAFLVSSCYAIAITKGLKLDQRIYQFSVGAANKNILLMIWIFILAGAFAHSAKQMGAIDATVNLTLHILPDNLLLAGIFIAACFISLSIGTSVGTIVALTPVAVGLAEKTEIALPFMVAVVVGGSFFGDNLSFISDTTIASTKTQECVMRDKFRVNSMIVVPAAIIVLGIYIFQGLSITAPAQTQTIEWIKVIPYIIVLCMRICSDQPCIVLLTEKDVWIRVNGKEPISLKANHMALLNCENNIIDVSSLNNTLVAHISHDIIKDYLRFLNKDLSQIPVWQRSATPILTLPCLTPDVFRVAAQHSMMPAETESEKERTRALLFTVLSRFLDSKKFLSLMMYMLRNCVSDSVYQIIESDIHKDWNLSMVASCLCLSPSLLKKKLKSENTSYSQIITTCRMRYAVNELMMDGKNISQVSQSCGYNSTSYFISVFKDFYGMTPLHYVSQHRERTVA